MRTAATRCATARAASGAMMGRAPGWGRQKRKRPDGSRLIRDGVVPLDAPIRSWGTPPDRIGSRADSPSAY